MKVFEVPPEAVSESPAIYRLIYNGVWGQTVEAVQIK